MTGKETDPSSPSRGRKLADTPSEDLTLQKTPCVVALDFEELAQGQPCILIRVADETYTLRKTQSGKLVLNQ